MTELLSICVSIHMQFYSLAEAGLCWPLFFPSPEKLASAVPDYGDVCQVGFRIIFPFTIIVTLFVVCYFCYLVDNLYPSQR